MIGESVQLSAADLTLCVKTARAYLARENDVSQSRRVHKSRDALAVVTQGYIGELSFKRLFPKAERDLPVNHSGPDNGIDYWLNGQPIDVKTIDRDPESAHLVIEKHAARKKRADFACMYWDEANTRCRFCGFFCAVDLDPRKHIRPHYAGAWVKCSDLFEFVTLLERTSFPERMTDEYRRKLEYWRNYGKQKAKLPPIDTTAVPDSVNV